MNIRSTRRNPAFRSARVTATALTLAALLAVAVATVACGSNSGNADRINRANISDLPTPTGGEIFASADELADATSIEVEAVTDDTLFEGGAGVEGTIIEDVVAQNPEIAALIQKVQSGQATDADFERLDTLLSEAFAGDGPFGFSAIPTGGTIQTVNGNSILIQPLPDEQDITEPPTTVTINDQTQILVASEIGLPEIEVNSDVDVIAIRGGDGIIRARTITLADIDDVTVGADGAEGDAARAFGRRTPFSRLLRGTGLAAPRAGLARGPAVIQGAGAGQPQQGRTPGARFAARAGANQQPDQSDAAAENGVNQLFDDAEGIPAQGRVTKIEEARLHIEAEQGPLRVTIDDQTEFVRIASGTSADIAEGLAAITFTDPDNVAIMIMVGPETLLFAPGSGFNVIGP